MKRILYRVYRFVVDFRIREFIKAIFRPRGIFQERYTLENGAMVLVYTNDLERFSVYQPRKLLDRDRARSKVRVSLIATLRNEKDNIEQWVQSIWDQSRPPDEVVVVDAGSQDGSTNLLKSLVAKSPVPFKVIVEPDVNIARGRNIAIAQSSSPIIAVTDFGCRPRAEWLENLIFPFEDDQELQVIGGWYEAIDNQGRPVHRRSWPVLEQVNPKDFLPSSRSIAFRKAVWQDVGGYPEWLTLTGEDTYFAMELKRCTSRWAFVPEAVVEWLAPKEIFPYWKKQYLWSLGDGESGVNAKNYWVAALETTVLATGVVAALLAISFFLSGLAVAGFVILFIFLVIMTLVWFRAQQAGYAPAELLREAGAKLAQVLGFAQGAQSRDAADRRRFKAVRGIFLILSGVPIDDTGGGARCTQIAQELLRRQYMVLFINKFPKYESVDLGIKIRHPNLSTFSLAEFSLDNFMRRFSGILAEKSSGVLVEFPLNDFLLLLRPLSEAGAAVIYDLLDNWDTSLGRGWYSVATERRLIDHSDILVATAPVLVKRLEEMSSRPVKLLPNAVNLRLFDADRTYQRPEDLPLSEFTIIYTGALWGEWFDWQLLEEIACFFDSASVVLIGDYRGQASRRLPNLHFLGLKAHSSLPAYLSHAHVAILPWKVSTITEATSPLKLYEYLAMRKPVVVPDLPLLVGLPYVFPSKDNQEFLGNIQRVHDLEVSGEAIESFLRKNSWQARVDYLVRAIEKSSKGEGSHVDAPGISKLLYDEI
jgi:glycosyltransferase involved in cell wall biosynthesis